MKRKTPAAEPDAVAMIEEAALDPTLDELALRARACRVQPFPSEAEIDVMVEHWRRERASWGNAKEQKE